MQAFWQLLGFVAALLGRVWRRCARVGTARRQAAQGLVEYGIILVLMAIVVVGLVTDTGRRVSSTYGEISCTLARENGEGPTNNGVNRECSTNPGNGRNN